MIPKKIWMIWFGNQIPDFVHYSFETFKKINLDFECELLFYSIKNINDIYVSKQDKLNDMDLLLYKSIQLAKSQIINGRVMPILPRLSYFFRQFIINKFGGIYLDCDMFPIKKFDDELLRSKFISSRIRFLTNKNIKLQFENNFFGNCCDTKIYNIAKDYISDGYDVLYPIKDYGTKFNNLINLFYNCKLKIGDFYGHFDLNYVDHYSKWIWNPNKCKVLKTIIDDDIQKIKKYNINFI